MQSPPFPRYLVPPRSKDSPRHHILKHPQLPFLLLVNDQVLHPYKTIDKIIILYILIFKFLDSNLEDKMIIYSNNGNTIITCTKLLLNEVRDVAVWAIHWTTSRKTADSNPD